MKPNRFPALIALLISACAVGPNYRRPPVSTPESYRGQSAATTSEGVPFGDLPWWEVFRDPTLQDLIRRALDQNKDLRIAIIRVEEGRGVYRATQGQQFPEIGLRAGAARNWAQKSQGVSPSGGVGAFSSAQVGLDLSYQLDLFGQYRRATEAAKADLLKQDEFRRTVMITLISDVARAYFELREFDEELAITNRTVGTRGRSLKLVRARLEGGLVSLLDVRQSEAELAIATRTVPQLERLIALKENEISLLLGENPRSIERDRSVKVQGLPPTLPIDMPSVLLERRPDIRGAEQQLIAANARIGEAKALFFPQLNLAAFAGMSAVGGPLGATSAVASAAGSLFQFIFDGGRRKGNYEAAKARFEEALVRYEQVIQQSLREVSDALISIDKLKGVRKEQEALVAASVDGLRLANARYEGGVSSYLEVLETERQSFDSQLALAATKKDQLVAVVQLYRALGGGWFDAEKAAAESPAAPESSPSAEAKPAQKSDL